MKVVDKAESVQQKVEIRIKEFGRGKYGRVLKMAKKPDTEEYIRTCKLAAIGIILIGALGFFIYWIWNNVPGFFKP